MGWARALLWHSKATRPPPYGSLLEYVFLVVQQYHLVVDSMRVRAIVQASHDPDKAPDAYKEYRDALFHIDAAAQKAAMQNALSAWTGVKAIQFSSGTKNDNHSHKSRIG